MKLAALIERQKHRERRVGVRLRESRLTLALAAIKLAECQGAIIKSRRLRGA